MPNYTLGSTRVALEQPDLTTFQGNGSVVLDSRRTRPLWFDGRFMAARDLEREQNYFLQREADLAQAAGFESMQGLLVDQVLSNGQAAGSGTIVVHAGEGVTPAGELVAIPNDLTIQLSELAASASQDAQFGLSAPPWQPSQNRTGLYVVALQPVEFTANPIVSYPTTVLGPRTTRNGDIVSATAVLLAPYPNPPGTYAANLQQAALARQIFVTGNAAALSDALLPLAVISLNQGAVQWIDTYLVRRDSGSQFSGVRFGLTDPASQQAYLMQYDAMLQAAVAARQAGGLKANFAATDFFLAIPPAGRFPFDAIDAGSFSQVFFPQEMDVRLSIIPSDEWPALLQDGMSLPPIDLTLPATAYANMSVFALIPVPRANLAALQSSLPDTPLNPTLPQVLANRSPIELLRLFQGSETVAPVPPVSNNAWAAAIGSQQYGFYLRRPSDPSMVDFKTPAGVALTSSANPSTEGQVVTFTAQVSPAAATGSVQFMNGATAMGTGALTGGIATLAVPFPAVGVFTITATYGGDAANTAGTSPPLTQTVVKAISSVALASSVNPSNPQQAVTFTATVAPNTATGSVQFLDGAAVLGTGTLSGGTATLAVSTLASGTHSITAAYAGDTNTGPSASPVLTQTVRAASSVTLASSLNPSNLQQTVTFTATVAPKTATGSVEFLDGATVLGTGALSGGVATLQDSTLTAGAHAITAAYAGDANTAPATSAVLPQTVRAASGVALASSVNPSNLQQTVTFTATVTPTTATGSVKFLDGVTVLGTGTLSGGIATLPISTLAAGAHSITAAYSGDGNNAASTSPALTQTVRAASTVSLTSSVNPSNPQQPVLFTAAVTSGATGTVTFLDGTTTLGTGAVSSGAATLSVSTLAAGPHSITAAYGGDGSFAPGTSAVLTQIVRSASSVTLASSLNPSNVQQAVVFTAAVPSGATGTVTFLDGATALGTGAVGSGRATLSTATLAAGAHTITAAYGGDGNNAASTSAPLVQTVKALSSVALTSSLNPSTVGASVTFTAKLSPATATGAVSFMDGSTVIGSPAGLSAGVATQSTTTLTAGAHSITAVYPGDANNAGSTSPALAQSVKAATSVALVSAANPSTVGQAVVFTATVAPNTATGSVQFLDGTTALGTGTLSAGVATLSVTTLAAGAHSITAAYPGDGSNAPSTSTPVAQAVKASTTVALASSVNPSNPSQAVVFTATVTPKTATGSIQFLDGTANLGTGTLSAGVATLSVSTLASGGHSITAAYPGDASNLASTSAALAQTVKTASSVALISSLNPSTAPQSVTFTATVTPKSATGSVQILDGSTALGTGGLNGGVATLSVSTLTAGAHSITAAYPGDANDTASTSPALAQTVKTASSVALASSVNPSNLQQSVTFTATVTPKTATGSVQFLDGTATLGTGGLNSGVATLGVATLAAGAHSITAAYPGDGTTTASTSPPVAQTVKASSTVTLTSSAPRVTVGQAVVFTARVTPATATGNIQFMDGTTLLGTVALNVDGAATLTNSNLTAGSHSITAVYAGDSKTAGSTSTPLVQTIDAPIQ